MNIKHKLKSMKYIFTFIFFCSISMIAKAQITLTDSILVDEITDNQREEIIKQFKKIYVTDNKYRLMVCIDERSKVYPKRGYHTIYHLALENDFYYGNYGIYANGLLVESCSKRYLKELSNMTLI